MNNNRIEIVIHPSLLGKRKSKFSPAMNYYGLWEISAFLKMHFPNSFKESNKKQNNKKSFMISYTQ